MRRRWLTGCLSCPRSRPSPDGSRPACPAPRSRGGGPVAPDDHLPTAARAVLAGGRRRRGQPRRPPGEVRRPVPRRWPGADRRAPDDRRPARGRARDAAGSPCRVVFDLADGRQLGSAMRGSSGGSACIPVVAGDGWPTFSPGTGRSRWPVLHGRPPGGPAPATGARLKTLLLDQSFIAGVGNIYADEALWRARLPLRTADT